MGGQAEIRSRGIDAGICRLNCKRKRTGVGQAETGPDALQPAGPGLSLKLRTGAMALCGRPEGLGLDRFADVDAQRACQAVARPETVHLLPGVQAGKVGGIVDV